eukprot:2466528-Rhodomonas_salina.1
MIRIARVCAPLTLVLIHTSHPPRSSNSGVSGISRAALTLECAFGVDTHGAGVACVRASLALVDVEALSPNVPAHEPCIARAREVTCPVSACRVCCTVVGLLLALVHVHTPRPIASKSRIACARVSSIPAGTHSPLIAAMRSGLAHVPVALQAIPGVSVPARAPEASYCVAACRVLVTPAAALALVLVETLRPVPSKPSIALAQEISLQVSTPRLGVAIVRAHRALVFVFTR